MAAAAGAETAAGGSGGAAAVAPSGGGFVEPHRFIFDAADHEAFTKSKVYEDLLMFVAAINHAVAHQANDAECTVSPVVAQLVTLLGEMAAWVDDIPPLAQPMRYGNKAFRLWHTRLVREARRVCASLLTADTAGAEVELAPYLYDAFGNATRIDYGTGHETAFIIFLYCLAKLKLVTPADLTALGVRVFPAYIAVCRKLQRTYWLEPAGSHGVWSLDDYQFLVFLFGSSQLVDNKHIRPRSIHAADVLEGFADKYMYLAAIRFISDVKMGAPFAEHSPMLNDIANLPSWKAINDGLGKMYKAEVLGKLPVVQHLVFGTLFPASWTPSRTPVPSESMVHAVALAAPTPELAAAVDAIADALAAETVPVDDAMRATAPWVTAPQVPDITTTGVAPWAAAALNAAAATSGAAAVAASAAAAAAKPHRSSSSGSADGAAADAHSHHPHHAALGTPAHGAPAHS